MALERKGLMGTLDWSMIENRIIAHKRLRKYGSPIELRVVVLHFVDSCFAAEAFRHAIVCPFSCMPSEVPIRRLVSQANSLRHGFERFGVEKIISNR